MSAARIHDAPSPFHKRELDYHSTMEAFGFAADDETVMVMSRSAGGLPGGPIELVTFSDHRITVLEVRS